MNQPASAPRRTANWPAVLVLLLTAIVIGLTVDAVVQATKDRITDQREQARLLQLRQLLPAGSYDNALHRDVLSINAPGQFQTDAPVLAYRARRGNTVIAVIFALTAHNGYNGDIDLLVAIDPAATLLAVRVVRHQETPGLGDGVELRQSDWIHQFAQLPAASLGDNDWQLRKYGGQFEQLTGATITAAAVLDAVQRSVDYFQNHRQQLLDAASLEPAL